MCGVSGESTTHRSAPLRWEPRLARHENAKKRGYATAKRNLLVAPNGNPQAPKIVAKNSKKSLQELLTIAKSIASREERLERSKRLQTFLLPAEHKANVQVVSPNFTPMNVAADPTRIPQM